MQKIITFLFCVHIISALKKKLIKSEVYEEAAF